ncbi:MAG: hypothetical protein U0Y08_11660 [Bacteroidia bacterium]
MKKLSYVLMLALLAGITSCKKDDETTDNGGGGSTTPTVNTTPTYSDADGVLAAVYTNNWITMPFVGTMNMPIGTAVAAFSSTTGGSTYVDAGVVKCEDSTLTKNSSNAYYFNPSMYNPYGLSLGGNVSWDVAGNASVPVINYTTSGVIPSVDSISNGTTINKSNAYTLSVMGSISNSDSVIFVVAGPSATLMVTRPAGTTSHTFSATEMGTIGSGSGVVEVVPYNWESTTISGKKFYFVNEAAATKLVTIN